MSEFPHCDHEWHGPDSKGHVVCLACRVTRDERFDRVDTALERLDRLEAALEGMALDQLATPRDPALGWCEAETKSGERCLNDAERDGLCRMHWRMANRG